VLLLTALQSVWFGFSGRSSNKFRYFEFINDPKRTLMGLVGESSWKSLLNVFLLYLVVVVVVKTHLLLTNVDVIGNLVEGVANTWSGTVDAVSDGNISLPILGFPKLTPISLPPLWCSGEEEDED